MTLAECSERKEVLTSGWSSNEELYANIRLASSPSSSTCQTPTKTPGRDPVQKETRKYKMSTSPSRRRSPCQKRRPKSKKSTHRPVTEDQFDNFVLKRVATAPGTKENGIQVPVSVTQSQSASIRGRQSVKVVRTKPTISCLKLEQSTLLTSDKLKSKKKRKPIPTFDLSVDNDDARPTIVLFDASTLDNTKEEAATNVETKGDEIMLFDESVLDSNLASVTNRDVRTTHNDLDELIKTFRLNDRGSSKGTQPAVVLWDEAALDPNDTQLASTYSASSGGSSQCQERQEAMDDFRHSKRKETLSRHRNERLTTTELRSTVDSVTDESLLTSGKMTHRSEEVDASMRAPEVAGIADDNIAKVSSRRVKHSMENAKSASVSKKKESAIVLHHRHFVQPSQWVPHKQRKSCYVCLRDFSVLRKKHTCRMCGQVICGRCSVFELVDIPFVSRCRICTSCFVSYRKQARKETSECQQLDAAHKGSASPELISIDTKDSSDDNDDDSLLEAIMPRESIPILSPPEFSNSDLYLPPLPSDCLLYNDSFSTIESVLPHLTSRSIEGEFEAAVKARDLEKEVEDSRQRIALLEERVQLQEASKERLSDGQQQELMEARKLISDLESKLLEQEESMYVARASCSSIRYPSEDGEENSTLKKKLKMLERQLKDAGISAAEMIPYEVAKRKVQEISQRMQEITREGATQNCREYFVLEQQMEKYNTALLLSDEYIEEQARKDREWEESVYMDCVLALQQVRACIPVDLSRLSERELLQLESPSGGQMSAELAKRLKRTSVLSLLREDPSNIAKMHPSVIESYRATGLCLLERRALHAALKEVAAGWKQRQGDELSLRKADWFKKLKETLATSLYQYERHCSESSAPSESHLCQSIGLACPVRMEKKVEVLYGNLGFPEGGVYIAHDVVKGDPDKAGEKALLEAQSHAKEKVGIHRKVKLKKHYKGQVREISLAMAAMDEMDAALDKLKVLDAELEAGSDCTALVQHARDTVMLLAKRTGICLIGKRDATKDGEDVRSKVEMEESSTVVAYVKSILGDVQDGDVASKGIVTQVTALVQEVEGKNEKAGVTSQDSGRTPLCKRVQREVRAVEPMVKQVEVKAQAPTSKSPTDLFAAIRKRQSNALTQKVEEKNETTQSSKTKAPMDLLAAIRKRQETS